jgi:hypothetical protein
VVVEVVVEIHSLAMEAEVVLEVVLADVLSVVLAEPVVVLGNRAAPGAEVVAVVAMAEAVEVEYYPEA